MLTAFRRHRADCKYKAKGRAWKRCDCPVWADGSMVNGKRPLISLKTTNWEEAGRKLLGFNTTGRAEYNPGQLTVTDAIDHFNADCESRKLASGTMVNYRWMLNSLSEFAKKQGIQFIAQIDINQLERFRHTWDCQPTTSVNYLVILKIFFQYAVNHEWITKNPASRIKRAACNFEPTQPYTIEEQQKIFGAFDRLISIAREKRRVELIRLRVMCLVMRYSGLRISDTYNLDTERLDGRRLYVSQQKTRGRMPVSCLLPQFVIDELDRCPRVAVNRWFSSSQSGCSLKYRRLYELVLKASGVSTEHHTFHRFRDTFAVSMLEAGVPIDQVSKMLGHSSIRTTEKHYAPWVKGRQSRLDSEMDRVNNGDPVLQSLSAPALLRRVK